MNTKRTIIVGDIHGCIDEFNELLNKISYKPNDDRVILLGDLIDRGPDSAAVVNKARILNLESVMGNHEHKLIKWNKSSEKNIHKNNSHYLEFSKEDIDYIERMPSFIRLDSAVILHGGAAPGTPIEYQKKETLLYLRYTDKDRNNISLRKIQKLGKEQSGAIFWTQFWKGPDSIIYGHNVHSYDYPLVEEVSPEVICYGLDTGCCFGGHLSALILETKEIVQVKAKQVYYKSDFEFR